MERVSLESKISGEILKRPSSTIRSLSDPNLFGDAIVKKEKEKGEQVTKEETPKRRNTNKSCQDEEMCCDLSNRFHVRDLIK